MCAQVRFAYRTPLYQHWLTSIPAWISNRIRYEMSNEITYPIPNFTVEGASSLWSQRYLYRRILGTTPIWGQDIILANILNAYNRYYSSDSWTWNKIPMYVVIWKIGDCPGTYTQAVIHTITWNLYERHSAEPEKSLRRVTRDSPKICAELPKPQANSVRHRQILSYQQLSLSPMTTRLAAWQLSVFSVSVPDIFIEFFLAHSLTEKCPSAHWSHNLLDFWAP